MKSSDLCRLAAFVAAAVPFIAAQAVALDGKPPATPPAATPPAPAAPAPAGGMSESKFLALVYGEIAKRTPTENASGPGEVAASFHVDAKGRVDKVTIDKTTSPAHADIVQKILDGVQVPPPPGGSFDLSQTFKFH